MIFPWKELAEKGWESFLTNGILCCVTYHRAYKHKYKHLGGHSYVTEPLYRDDSHQSLFQQVLLLSRNGNLCFFLRPNIFNIYSNYNIGLSGLYFVPNLNAYVYFRIAYLHIEFGEKQSRTMHDIRYMPLQVLSLDVL